MHDVYDDPGHVDVFLCMLNFITYPAWTPSIWMHGSVEETVICVFNGFLVLIVMTNYEGGVKCSRMQKTPQNDF